MTPANDNLVPLFVRIAARVHLWLLILLTGLSIIAIRSPPVFVPVHLLLFWVVIPVLMAMLVTQLALSMRLTWVRCLVNGFIHVVLLVCTVLWRINDRLPLGITCALIVYSAVFAYVYLFASRLLFVEKHKQHGL